MRKGYETLAITGAILLPFGAAACSDDTPNFEAAATTTTVPVEAGDMCGEDLTIEAQERAGRELAGVYQGFAEGELSIGCDDVDFAANPHEASATASFTEEQLEVLESNEEIGAYYALGTERSNAAAFMALSALAEEGLTGDALLLEQERLLSGRGYFPVQAHVPTTIDGTTYFVANDDIRFANGRGVEAGDIVWAYTTVEGQVIEGAFLRADCTNPHVTRITPTPPGETPPPISEIPPKFDDGRLPGDPNVPADQDPGTPDVPGQGPAGQTPDGSGRVPGETLPTSPDVTATPTTEQQETTPSTGTQPETEEQPVTTVTTPPNNTMPTQPRP